MWVLTRRFRLKYVVLHVQEFLSLDDTLYNFGLSVAMNARTAPTGCSVMFLGYVKGSREYHALFQRKYPMPHSVLDAKSHSTRKEGVPG